MLPAYGDVWIDGTASSLTDTAGNIANTGALAIFVSGADVFVAGIGQYGTTHGIPYTNNSAVYPLIGKVATLWKNDRPAFPVISSWPAAMAAAPSKAIPIR
jgi:hypothetical protein